MPIDLVENTKYLGIYRLFMSTLFAKIYTVIIYIYQEDYVVYLRKQLPINVCSKFFYMFVNYI